MRNRILALDPGKTTGWATWSAEGVFESGQMDYDETCSLLYEVAGDAQPHGIDIVSEAFIITVNTAKNTQASWSLELIGVARSVSRRWCGQDIFLQQPAAAKRMMSDDMLKVLDWYKPGKGHANDAARHLGLYMLTHGWMDNRIIEYLKQ